MGGYLREFLALPVWLRVAPTAVLAVVWPTCLFRLLRVDLSVRGSVRLLWLYGPGGGLPCLTARLLLVGRAGDAGGSAGYGLLGCYLGVRCLPLLTQLGGSRPVGGLRCVETASEDPVDSCVG